MKHYRKILFLILWGLVSFYASGQTDIYDYRTPAAPPPASNPYCTPSSPDWNYYGDFHNYIPDANTPIKTIRVNIHIMGNSIGGNNFGNNGTDIARIEYIMDNAAGIIAYPAAPSDPPTDIDPSYHAAISDTRIRIDYGGHTSPRIYFHTSPVGGTDYSTSANNAECESYITSLDPSYMDNLNIYFTDGSGFGTGYTTLPSTDYNFNSFSMILGAYNSGSTSKDYLYAECVAHELGHCLDICHTYILPGAGCWSTLADCIANNDYYEDIYGDPSVSNTYSFPHLRCWGCNLSIPLDKYTNNLMGGCQDELYISPLQIAKFHWALAMLSVRKYVTGDSYTNSDPLYVTGNQTWDWNMRVYTDVVVTTGSTLTITCKLIMGNTAIIYVQPGAHLIVDGAIISNDNGGLWQGITILGNKSMPQTTASQGYATLTNSTFVNAHDAVTVGDGWNQDGGWVKANGNTFTNCYKAFQFLAYQTPGYSQSLANNLNPAYWNLSRITNNTMECTGLLNPGSGTLGSNYFVTLWAVNGVGIYGNNFVNSASGSLLSATERATGIYSIDASYLVHRADDVTSNPCAGGSTANGAENTFNSLTRGIDFYASPGNVLDLEAYENNFDNICDIAVNVENDNQSEIWGNNFNYDGTIVGDVGPIPRIYGIESNTSEKIEIESNTMTWNDNSHSYGGIYIANSDNSQPCQILGNSMSNNPAFASSTDLIGNIFYGDNENLNVENNSYHYIKEDWHVEYTTPNFMNDQGASGFGANNSFTTPAVYSNIDFNLAGSGPYNYYTVNRPTVTGTTGPFNFHSAADVGTAPKSFCKIYGDRLNYQDYKRGITNKIPNVMGDIYSGQLDRAGSDAASLSDPDLKSYYSAVLNIYKAGRNFTKMTTGDITSLERFTGENNAAGSAARHVLEFFVGKHYPQKPFVHVEGQQDLNTTSGINTSNNATPQFAIYPNPAASQFVVKYNIIEKGNLIVKWYDALGREVAVKNLSGQQGSITVQNSEIGRAGLYKCVIFVDGNPVSSETLELR